MSEQLSRVCVELVYCLYVVPLGESLGDWPFGYTQVSDRDGWTTFSKPREPKPTRVLRRTKCLPKLGIKPATNVQDPVR